MCLMLLEGEYKMIKILYILPNLYISSGVSSIAMNYYRNIDSNKIKIDFLVMKKSENSFEEEIKEKNGEIFYMKNNISVKNIKKIKTEISDFFEQHIYDAVELHAPNFSFLFLKIAKEKNIPVRIVHSHSTIHSTNKIKNLIDIFLNINMKKYANTFFSCSQKSGEYWYGNKICNSSNYYFIPNAVDINIYKPNNHIREEIRKKYNLDDKIVVGFVGRISKDKNIPFLTKIINEVAKENENYFFIIVGDGTELKKMKDACKEIQNNIVFLGIRNDVNNLLNSFDLLLLPSKREGLPAVAIEAQMSNVECYLSDTISKDTDIGGVTFLPINEKIWVNEILNYKKKDLKISSEKFNIKPCSIELENIYIKLCEREEK